MTVLGSISSEDGLLRYCSRAPLEVARSEGMIEAGINHLCSDTDTSQRRTNETGFKTYYSLRRSFRMIPT